VEVDGRKAMRVRSPSRAHATIQDSKILMPNLPEIVIEPELLRWARETLGVKIDEVADTLKVSKSDVVKWESEASPLRLTQLEKLSELYKRPLAAFFLPTVPKEPALPRDFRKLPGKTPEFRTVIPRVFCSVRRTGAAAS